MAQEAMKLSTHMRRYAAEVATDCKLFVAGRYPPPQLPGVALRWGLESVAFSMPLAAAV